MSGFISVLSCCCSSCFLEDFFLVMDNFDVAGKKYTFTSEFNDFWKKHRNLPTLSLHLQSSMQQMCSHSSQLLMVFMSQYFYILIFGVYHVTVKFISSRTSLSGHLNRHSALVTVCLCVWHHERHNMPWDSQWNWVKFTAETHRGKY